MVYIAIFNLILSNETNDNLIIYDEKINNFLNRNNRRSAEGKEDYYPNNESNFCFVKIEFYKNGDIKNYYLPNGFLLGFFSYIEEIIKLIIPKISKNFYVDSIENKLNEINELYTENDNGNITDEFEDLNEDETSDFTEESNKKLRHLNLYSKKYYGSVYAKKRLLEENSSVYEDYNNSNLKAIFLIISKII